MPLLSYLQGSFFRIFIELNPFRWKLYFDFTTYSEHDPGFIFQLLIEFGPISIDFCIDDIRW